MKFHLQFGLDRQKGSMYDNYNPGKALDIVEIVREYLGKPNFPVEKIEAGACHIDSKGFDITLDSSRQNVIDAAAKHFQVENTVHIVIPVGYLSRFIIMDLRVERKTFDDNFQSFSAFEFCAAVLAWCTKIKMVCPIKMVYTNYIVDDDALLEAWINDGCPTYWGITREEHEKILSDAATKCKIEHEKEVAAYEAETLHREECRKAAALKREEEAAKTTEKDELKKLADLTKQLTGALAYIKEHYSPDELKEKKVTADDE